MSNLTASKLAYQSYEEDCSACGQSGWSYIASAHAGSYYRCNNCRYHIQVPEENVEQQARFELEQEKHYDENSLCKTPLYEFLTELRLARRMKILTKVLPTGKLLEVGPGMGGVVARALAQGYQVDAVEHSTTLASIIEKEYGIEVKTGEFEKMDLPEEEYDAYMSFHVIEHVADVTAHLEQAHRIVKPGGLAIIATPNADSWEHRMPFGISPNYSSAHLQLFSKKSLISYLEKSGWELVELQTPSYLEYWVRVVTSTIRYSKLRFTGKTIARGQMADAGSDHSSTKFRLFRIVELLTKPIRFLQEKALGGGELLVVAKRLSE